MTLPVDSAPGVLRGNQQTNEIMNLILNDAPAVHWALAGLGIAVITFLFQWLKNTNLGISTAFEDLCSFVSDAPFFKREAIVNGKSWRMPFLLGLLIAGFLSALSTGGWEPTWDLGMLDQQLTLEPTMKVLWMFVGGIFIGFGTRMAGGCTSGHGIFGNMNLDKASFVSTICFMGAGVLTSHLIYKVLLGA